MLLAIMHCILRGSRSHGPALAGLSGPPKGNLPHSARRTGRKPADVFGIRAFRQCFSGLLIAAEDQEAAVAYAQQGRLGTNASSASGFRNCLPNRDRHYCYGIYYHVWFICPFGTKMEPVVCGILV